MGGKIILMGPSNNNLKNYDKRHNIAWMEGTLSKTNWVSTERRSFINDRIGLYTLMDNFSFSFLIIIIIIIIIIIVIIIIIS